MTQRHFEAIAAHIKSVHDEAPASAGRIAAKRIALAHTDYFATINPHFDRQRFLTACGF